MTDNNQRARAPAAHVAGASPSTGPDASSRRTPHPRVNAALLELDEAVSVVNAAVSSLPDVPLGLLDATLADLSGSLISLNLAVSDLSDEVSVAFSVNAASSPTVSGPASASATPAPDPAAAAPASGTAAAPAAATGATATPAANNGLFHTTGPWIAGHLYSVVPLAPLAAVPDNHEKWFAITRGRYVGLTTNSAISLNAVTGIAGGLSDRCTTQADALQHFNAALAVNAVAVLT